MKIKIASLAITAIIVGIVFWINKVDSALTLPLSKISPLSAELETKSETGIITWQEYRSLISAYNAKLDEIRNNCDLDKRCQNGKVIFGAVKNGKDVVKIMNKFLRDDNSLYAK